MLSISLTNQMAPIAPKNENIIQALWWENHENPRDLKSHTSATLTLCCPLEANMA